MASTATEAKKITIGGSDARRIMAGEALAVWEEMTGRRQREDLSLFLPAMIGKATEGVNRAYYRHRTKRTVYDPRPTSGVEVGYNVVGEDRLGISLCSKFYPWLVGHVDGLVQDVDWGVFESKHTGAISEWNPPEAVVEKNFWQGAHYCLLTGFGWVDFSCLYGLGDWATFRVVPTEDQLTLLLGRLNRFVRAVKEDKPPEGASVAIEAPPIDPRRVYTEAEVRQWPIANELAMHAAEIAQSWTAAEKFDTAMASLKSLAFPEDLKSFEAFGITMAIAKNGAKRVRPAVKAPAGALV